MNGAGDELMVLRLTTAQFSGRDAVEAFREKFGRTILRIDMQPSQNCRLEADMTLRAFSGFGIASGLLSPMRNRHGPELIDNDDLVLVVVHSGFGVLEQRGRGVEVGEGQVVLTDNAESATFAGQTATQVLNLRLNRASLAPHIADLGATLRSPLIPDSPALRLLKSYANSLHEEASLSTPQLRHAVAMHMHDLAALAMGATDEGAEVAKLRGVRAARLRAIQTDIAARLADSHLSIDAVAARHGITPRYVRMLFEVEGTGFSEFVLLRRLQRAHRMLTDTRYDIRTISAIAFDCGFSDLSYFNRTFRRRYGMTPTDVRTTV